MVLFRYRQPGEGGEDCYYDDQAEECIWVLPPLVEGSSLPEVDVSGDTYYAKKLDKAYSKVCLIAIMVL